MLQGTNVSTSASCTNNSSVLKTSQQQAICQSLPAGRLLEFAKALTLCRVSDPTGVIWGTKLYKVILANLFDPQRSTVKLKKIRVTGPSSIEAVWTKEGFLQLPWNPYLTTQEGRTVSCQATYPVLASAVLPLSLYASCSHKCLHAHRTCAFWPYTLQLKIACCV